MNKMTTHDKRITELALQDQLISVDQQANLDCICKIFYTKANKS